MKSEKIDSGGNFRIFLVHPLNILISKELILKQDFFLVYETPFRPTKGFVHSLNKYLVFEHIIMGCQLVEQIKILYLAICSQILPFLMDFETKHFFNFFYI